MISAVAGRIASHLALIFLILLGGCSRLPDYGKPRSFPRDAIQPGAVVSYRYLDVADFQAKDLPDHLHDHGQHVNAYSAVAIRAAPGSQYILSPPNNGLSIQVYSVLVKNLAFEAVLLPAHSWWNPSLAREKFAYVLQHEQIHFALMEVAARRLTGKAEREQAQLAVFDSSAEAAAKRLLQKIEEWLAESEEDVLREHTEFDEDTSGRYVPEVQQEWFERVEKVLKDLAGRD